MLLFSDICTNLGKVNEHFLKIDLNFHVQDTHIKNVMVQGYK